MNAIAPHGTDVEEIKSYNSIYSTRDISIAECFFCEDRKSVGPFSHKHDEYEFMIPINTIPLLIYEKANYIGEVGYIYPVNPGVTHGLALPADKSHFFDIIIRKEYLDELKEKIGYSDKMFFTRFETPYGLFALIRELQDELAKRNANSYRICSLTKVIASTLIEDGLSRQEDNRRPEKKYHKNIKNIIVYMTNNYFDKQIDIVKLAEMSGYSSTYFTKAFKGYMNDSPIVHLNKLRISEAKAMMYRGETLFSKIADAVGYSNLSSFTEAFKRVTGKKPTDYYNIYISGEKKK